jgi:hypothetical protein
MFAQSSTGNPDRRPARLLPVPAILIRAGIRAGLLFSIPFDDAMRTSRPKPLDAACEKTGAPSATTTATEGKSPQKAQRVTFQ